MILVAVTVVDGQSRSSDEAINRPLNARYEQKMAKCHKVADENGFQFVPTVFSHAGQIHESIKRLIKEQTRHKLILFEGEAKRSKVKSTMKWWSKYISMGISKTANRSVAFKAGKMSEAVFEIQADFGMPDVGGQVFSSERESLYDVERSADLLYLYKFSTMKSYSINFKNLFYNFRVASIA